MGARELRENYSVDFDFGLQIDAATPMGSRNLWRKNYAANAARAAAAAERARRLCHAATGLLILWSRGSQ
jgi:hypothetical protein